jgi:hypothetical protein
MGLVRPFSTAPLHHRFPVAAPPVTDSPIPARYPLPSLNHPPHVYLCQAKNRQKSNQPVVNTLCLLKNAQNPFISAQNLRTFVQNPLKTSALLLIFVLSPFRR